MPQQTCPWAQGDLYQAYHDQEWGVPCRDGRRLFEKLCLEGQQAGLSWITVLKKREHYRLRFHGFDPVKIAAMSDAELDDCLTDAGLIRHRLKIYALRKNAVAYLAMEKSGQHFAEFIWSFVDNAVQINRYTALSDLPTQTAASVAMSKALKQRGFTFVGPTICYAFMQSMGLVNDHLLNCPQHPDNQGQLQNSGITG